MAPAAPLARHRHLAVPKGTHSASEDAAAVREEEWPLRAAVADGATESAFAAHWARVLVQGAIEQEATPSGVQRGLPDWQRRWQQEVRARAKEQPWYVQAKTHEGAFAALLALEIHPNGQWQAVSVGDCNLLQLRDGTLRTAWPTDDPASFTHRPALVPSRASSDSPSPLHTRGTWVPEDTFLLATDAVAAWLLRTAPARPPDESQAAFRDAVESARADGTLRSDDATLLVLDVESDDSDG